MLRLGAAIGFVAMVVCAIAFQGIAVAANSDSRGPLRSISITVPDGARDRVFAQFHNYADEYSWAIRIAPTVPDGDHFLVAMYREDLKILGTNAIRSNTFRLYFHPNSTRPVPTELLEVLVAALKTAVSRVQGTNPSDVPLSPPEQRPMPQPPDF